MFERTHRGVCVAVAVVGLLLAAPAAASAAFPGENGKIAFGMNSQIYTVNPDGTGQTALAQGKYPAWSADGHKLVFVNTAGHLAVMNEDGSSQTDLGVGPEPAGCSLCSIQYPTWSPDGTRIAYMNFNRDGSGQYHNDIYVASAAPGRGDQAQVPMCDDTGCYRAFSAPSWSPDGAWIAVETISYACEPCGIWKIHPDGTDFTAVFPGDGIQGGEDWPDWSPDGSQFVFAEEVYADLALGVVNSDGTGYTLIDSPRCCFWVDPAWSPDGQKFVVAWDNYSVYPDARRLFVMNRDGTGKTLIVYLPSDDDYVSPSWQPIPRNQPPDCSSVAASRPVLATPNRRFVAITLDGATDPEGDPVTITVDGVTQDEPVESRGDATTPDAIDDGEGQVRIRAERDPRGDGRVYRIAFTAADGQGGSCSGTVIVSVPRKRHKSAIDSAPPSYDSFAPTSARAR